MSCAFQVSTIVVGSPMTRMTTASTAATRGPIEVERPCEQDRDRDEQNLAGAESDPGRLGDAHEVEQEQAER